MTSSESSDDLTSGETQSPFERDSYFAATRQRIEFLEQQEDRSARLKLPRNAVRAMLAAVVVVAAVLTLATQSIDILRLGQPTPDPSGLKYCGGEEREQREAVERAVVVARTTSEGDGLISSLVNHSVCVRFIDLEYNAGYFWMSSTFKGWGDYHIFLDRSTVQYLTDDELAAVLVHEATHARRAFYGINCAQTRDCTLLPNGVAIEEEVAAHGAEARFWTAIEKDRDTTFDDYWSGSAGSFYLDQLTTAYQAGPKSFEAFVIEVRSDPREGEGITK